MQKPRTGLMAVAVVCCTCFELSTNHHIKLFERPEAAGRKAMILMLQCHMGMLSLTICTLPTRCFVLSSLIIPLFVRLPAKQLFTQRSTDQSLAGDALDHAKACM